MLPSRGDDRKLVLVIEDEPRILRLINLVLADRPIDIETAPDGATGLDWLRQHQPDLVLLDLALPDLDGWQVLAEIRGLAGPSELPVVIVTAQGDSATAIEARRLGANDFVSKPFRPAELRDVVDAFLVGGIAEAV
jgi:DNA-binding response OmpR family regulator